MATVIQTETAPRHLRPFTGYQGRPGEPIGVLSHTEDAMSVDLVASGNTAGLRLSLPLPVDYAYKLITGIATIRGADSTRWKRGRLNQVEEPTNHTLLCSKQRFGTRPND